MPNLTVGFLLVAALTLASRAAMANAVWDGWILLKDAERYNWWPLGNVLQDTAVLLEPLSEGEGARIWFSTDAGETAICLYSCADFYYKPNKSLTCWSAANAGAEMWPFLDACTFCPQLDGANMPAQHVPATQTLYYDARDCALPAGTVASDDTGTFILTGDCRYSL